MRLVAAAAALLLGGCSLLSGPLGQRVVEGSWRLDAISPDGRTLLVSTGFGGCEEYRGTDIDEGADEVLVRVRLAEPLGVAECTDELHVRQVHVTLDEPLGERVLVGCGGAPAACADLTRNTAGLGVQAPFAPAALAGGAAIIGTGLEGVIIGVDGATGAARWSRTVRDVAGDVALGELVAAGDLVLVEDQLGRLYALDGATGRGRWQRLAVSEVPGSPRGTVVVGDVVITVGPGDTVTAVGLGDGVERWSARPEGDAVFALAVGGDVALVLSGRLRVPGDPGAAVLTALDPATGATHWTYRAAGGPTELAVAASTAVVQVWGGMYGVTLEDGTERWRRVPFDHFSAALYADDDVVLVGAPGEPLARLDLESGAIGARFADEGRLRDSVAVADGLLFEATPDGRVVTRDAATGARRWQAEIGAPGARPAVGGGLVVVPTPLGAVALNAETGTLVWAWTRGPEAFADAASGSQT